MSDIPTQIEQAPSPRPVEPAAGREPKPTSAASPATPELTGQVHAAVEVLESIVSADPVQAESALREFADPEFIARLTEAPRETLAKEAASGPAADPEPAADGFDPPDAPDDTPPTVPPFPTFPTVAAPASTLPYSAAKIAAMPDTNPASNDTPAGKSSSPEPPNTQEAEHTPEEERELTIRSVLFATIGIDQSKDNPQNIPAKAAEEYIASHGGPTREMAQGFVDGKAEQTGPALESVISKLGKDIPLLQDNVDALKKQAKIGQATPTELNAAESRLTTAQTAFESITGATEVLYTHGGVAYQATYEDYAQSITECEGWHTNHPNPTGPEVEQAKKYQQLLTDLRNNPTYRFKDSVRSKESAHQPTARELRQQEISRLKGERTKDEQTVENKGRELKDAERELMALMLAGKRAGSEEEKREIATNIAAKETYIVSLKQEVQAAQARLDTSKEKLFPLRVDEEIAGEIDRLNPLTKSKDEKVKKAAKVAILKLGIAAAADNQMGLVLKSEVLTSSYGIQSPLKEGEQPISRDDSLLTQLQEKARPMTDRLPQIAQGLDLPLEQKRKIAQAAISGGLIDILTSDATIAHSRGVADIFFDISTPGKAETILGLLDPKSRLLIKEIRKAVENIFLAILAVIAEQIGGALMDEAEQDLTTPVTGSQRAA